MMKRYKICISYDGSEYAGWQVQPNAMTVQEKIEQALEQLAGEKIKVHGSGRTDQGVHARRQVAHFDMERPFKLDGLKKALNSILPVDIRIMKVNFAHSSFHARRSAVSKEYRYFIWNAEILPPFLRKYRTHIRKELDIAAMKKAASQLAGKHDFASFRANSDQKFNGTVRHLMKLTVTKHGSEIVIAAKSDGFLYKMVRSLAGFLIRVGEGALSPDETRSILHSTLRTARVPTAHPEGLFLWRVDY